MSRRGISIPAGDAEFGGTIASTDCPGSIRIAREDGAIVAVRLLGATRLIDATDQGDKRGSCDGFETGDEVEVDGKLLSNGTVNATQVVDELADSDDDGPADSSAGEDRGNDDAGATANPPPAHPYRTLTRSQ